MQSPRPNLFWWCVLAAIFFVLTLPAILVGRGGTIMAYDLTSFHWIEIQRIAKTFPAFNMADSFSATAPGFHWFLAGVEQFTHCTITELRVVGSTFALLAFLICWQVTQYWVGPLRGMLCIAPLMLSNYLLGSAIWMTTDTPGFALGALALAMAFCGSMGLRPSLMGGLFTAAAVGVRQTSLWCAGPGVLELIRGWRTSDRRDPALLTMQIGMWIVPPLAVLAHLIHEWGGLVPPRFQQFHSSTVNLIAPAVTLALLGLWGCVLLPCLLASLSKRQRSVSLLAGVLACAFACCVPTTQHIVIRPDSQVEGTPSQGRMPEFDADPKNIATTGVGRWGGPIWTIASRSPSMKNISWGVVGFAGLGGAVIAGLSMRAASRRKSQSAWVVCTMLAAMTAAQMANSQNFERYFDPWVLLGLGWLAAAGTQDDAGESQESKWCIAGLALMAIIQFGISVVQIYIPAFTGPSLNL